MATSGYSGLQSTISNAIGQISVPGAFGANLQPQSGLTTTAINAVLTMRGRPQGMVQSFEVDEQFNAQRVKAIGSAVDVALLPGVYEATGSFNKAFLYGTSIEDALGGGVRAVVGQYQQSANFKDFYFNIVLSAADGSSLAVYHDCLLSSIRRAYEINGVVIIDSAQLLIRWSE